MAAIQALVDKCKLIFSPDIFGLNNFYKAVIVIAGLFVIWLVLKRILGFIENKINKFEFMTIKAQSFTVIRKALLCLIIFIAGTYFIQISNLQLLDNVFYALIIALLANLIKDFIAIVIKYLEANVANKTDTKIDNILFDIFGKFAGVIIYGTALILALDILGVNIMPFVAGAGVAGIAIGFAAKDTLSNLIAGVLLIIDRPFEIGDRIEVWAAPAGSATWGDVIDIGLRATKIRTTDNIIIIIPNNEIMKRDIINYTIINGKIRVRVDIGVGYDADIKKTKSIIINVANSANWISKDPPPKVVVLNFGESSVDLQLRIWIDDARKRMDTISYITDKVKEAFDKAGIEIPYPKRDIIVTHKDIKTITHL